MPSPLTEDAALVEAILFRLSRSEVPPHLDDIKDVLDALHAELEARGQVLPWLARWPQKDGKMAVAIAQPTYISLGDILYHIPSVRREFRLPLKRAVKPTGGRDE